MRKIHKNQLIGVIDTLSEAHDEIQKLLKSNQKDVVKGLLSGCQDIAASAIDFIEELEGEGCEAVGLLEDYYKLAYQASLEFVVPERAAEFINHLRNQKSTIADSVRKGIKADKIEIAFLPYKASMWDSMESIWLAAKDDPDCDAFVVPVPYYEYTVTRELGKMCYEGGEYPKAVPVVNWEEYNIEERRPDAIIIHNPFDEYNIVTTVHQSFYAKRLQDFTDMLVYIPYYGSAASVYESNCLNPGTLYTDKVFVRSEEIRQTYIRAFDKWAKQKGITKGHPLWEKIGNPKEKFIALSSPKLDKAKNSRPEDFDIPNEWNGLIEDARRFGKKIILYNTRLTDMAAGIENQIEKLEFVLEFFKNQKRTLLLWRPHPLNIACLQTMRPHILSRYKRIVSGYKSAGWGIYDDTADLHRAIALSDAYIGDWSSLISIYTDIGKPVLRQNPHMIPDKISLKAIMFEDFYDDGENFWVTCFEYNALFKIYKADMKPKYMGSFPDEPIDGRRLYTSVCELNGKLYFTPYSASGIGVYDMGSGEFSRISFAASGVLRKNSHTNANFITSVPTEKGIYFIPYFYPAIMFYDTAKDKIIYFDDWLTSVSKLETSVDASYFSSAVTALKDDSKLILPCCNAGAAVEFDMRKGVSKVYPVNNRNDPVRYLKILKTEGEYWLLRSNGDIEITANLSSHASREVVTLPINKTSEVIQFCHMVYFSGYVWLFSCFDSEVFQIHHKTKRILKIEAAAAKSEQGGPLYPWSYFCAREHDNHILAVSAKSGCFMQFNAAREIVGEGLTEMSGEDCETLKAAFVRLSDGQPVIRETAVFTMADFIENSIYSAKKTNNQGTAGRDIYNHIKKALFE